MKLSLLIAFLNALILCSSAQTKEPLKLNSYKSWTKITEGGLSDNAKFAYYQIQNRLTNQSTIVVSSIDKKIRYELNDLKYPNFSGNSQTFTGILGDTLIFLDLYTGRRKEIYNINSYSISKSKKKEFLFTIDKTGNLHVFNSEGKTYFSLQHVNSYKLSPHGRIAMIKQQGGNNTDEEIISVVELESLKNRVICTGIQMDNFIFNSDEDKIAFTSLINNQNSIWFYKLGLPKAIMLAAQTAPGIDSGMIIETRQNLKFTPDGKQILFVQTKEKSTSAIDLDPQIWNYQDKFLRSEVVEMGEVPIYGLGKFLSSLCIEDRKIKKMLFRDEVIANINVPSNSKYLIIHHDFDIPINNTWNGGDQGSISILNIITGEKRLLHQNDGNHLLNMQISPDDNFLIYYDPSHRCYYYVTLFTKSGIQEKHKIDLKILTSNNREIFPERNVPPIIGWKNSSTVLLSDSYDIWEVDLKEGKRSINITKGLGVKDGISFGLVHSSNKMLGINKVLLHAFDHRTKIFSLYSLNPSNNYEIKKLCSGPYYFDILNNNGLRPLSDNDLIVSGENVGCLFKLQSATAAPNFYFSKDFKSFIKISDNEPQRSYNWLTTELHTYKDSSGQTLQGILYKPENFDNTKKYPLILNYYREHSNELNTYLDPRPNGGDIDIAYLVSNGYLVFRPDIIIRPEICGVDVINCLEGALEHLSQYKWIDFEKIAISGHSFGSWETNFILTHSKRKFAAAISSAGVCNMLSNYFSPAPNGSSMDMYVKYGPYKLSKSLSEAPDLYIRNSPLIFAKEISTPLLIMHNPLDLNVPFAQSREFFLELRSLGKPVWMLSYSNEGHVIFDEVKAVDYSKRMFEFFEYYLKNAPLPLWMDQPISAIN